MKLHLPTKLRAAVIAAMAFFVAAPAAVAMDIDPSTATYSPLWLGNTTTATIPEGHATSYHDRTALTLPTGLETQPTWTMVIEATGWKTKENQLIFGWENADRLSCQLNTDKKGWLEYGDYSRGFALMIADGTLVFVSPSIHEEYKGLLSGYEEGILSKGMGQGLKVDVNMTLSYDLASKVLTVEGGTIKNSSKTFVIDKKVFVGVELNGTAPNSNYTDFGGSDLRTGATTIVTTLIPSGDNAWNISGLTSLEGLSAGQYSTDIPGSDPETRAMLSTDKIAFIGGEGVLYTESDKTVKNSLDVGLNPDEPSLAGSIGLGTKAGTKMTVEQGTGALGKGEGLRIVGGGEVELQLGSAGINTTKLSIADGSTLSLTGNHYTQTLDMTAATTDAASSIHAEGGVNLHNADGSTIVLKELAATSANQPVGVSGDGTFVINKLNSTGSSSVNVGGTTGDKTALIVDELTAAGNLEVTANAALNADTATIGTANVRGTMAAAHLSGTSLRVDEMTTGAPQTYVSIRKQTTATAFTATNLAAQGASHALTADHVTDAIISPAPGGTATIKTAENISVLHGMDIAIHATTLTGGLTVTAEDITIDDTYTSRILAEMGDVESTGMQLTKKSELKANKVDLTSDELKLTGASKMNVGTLTAASGTTVTLSGASSLSTGAATLDTLSITGGSLANADQDLTAEMLTMSGAGSALAAKHLELGVANITTDSSAMVAMEDVVMEDALLTTTGATTSGITGATPGAGTLAVGSGYTFTGVTSDGTPAALDVMLVSLADNATLQNFAVGSATTVSAAGTQHLDNVKFAGGYNKMSFGGTPYFTVSDSFSNGSTLDSVAITGTAVADTLAADFITINGEGLLFENAGNDYTLFTMGDGVTLDFDTADVDKRQFNITPYTIASLTIENGGRELVIHGREAKAEIMDSLRSTPNRAAAMDNLDAAMQAGAEGQLINLFNYVGDVYHPTMEQRQIALSAASGASLANLSDAQRRGIEDVQQNLRNRIVQMGGHGEGVLRGGWDHADIQAWVQADGAYHTLGQNGDKAGYDTSVYGATAGANLDLNEHWTVGAALSVENGSLKGKGADNLDADTLSCYVNLFGRYQKGHWTHLGIFTIGMDDVDTKRTVLGMKGDGSTSGTSFSAYYELGYIFTLDDDARRILQPIINVSLTSAKMGSFTESGSIGTAGLKYDANNLFYGNVGIGARYQAVLSQSVYERNTVLELRAQLNEHFGNATDEADLTFIGGGNQFTAKGADCGNFGVQLGTGLSVPVGLQTTLFGDADAEFRAHQTDFRANIGVRYDF